MIQNIVKECFDIHWSRIENVTLFNYECTFPVYLEVTRISNIKEFFAFQDAGVDISFGTHNSSKTQYEVELQ